MSLETRIEELEKKLGLHEPPPLIFKIHFVSGESHEAESVLLMGPEIEDCWFERAKSESEEAFLARVDQPTIHPPKEIQS